MKDTRIKAVIFAVCVALIPATSYAVGTGHQRPPSVEASQQSVSTWESILGFFGL